MSVRILNFSSSVVLHSSAPFLLRMSGNRSRRQTPFVVDDTGVSAERTVDQVGGDAAALRSFDGLTIMESASDDAGSGWLGVEPSRPPSVRARAASRSMSGALSATSSMTDPPTLRSLSKQ